jgi:hypothetical protein
MNTHEHTTKTNRKRKINSDAKVQRRRKRKGNRPVVFDDSISISTNVHWQYNTKCHVCNTSLFEGNRLISTCLYYHCPDPNDSEKKHVQCNRCSPLDNWDFCGLCSEEGVINHYQYYFLMIMNSEPCPQIHKTVALDFTSHFIYENRMWLDAELGWWGELLNADIDLSGCENKLFQFITDLNDLVSNQFLTYSKVIQLKFTHDIWVVVNKMIDVYNNGKNLMGEQFILLLLQTIRIVLNLASSVEKMFQGIKNYIMSWVDNVLLKADTISDLVVFELYPTIKILTKSEERLVKIISKIEEWCCFLNTLGQYYDKEYIKNNQSIIFDILRHLVPDDWHDQYNKMMLLKQLTPFGPFILPNELGDSMGTIVFLDDLAENNILLGQFCNVWRNFQKIDYFGLTGAYSDNQTINKIMRSNVLAKMFNNLEDRTVVEVKSVKIGEKVYDAVFKEVIDGPLIDYNIPIQEVVKFDVQFNNLSNFNDILENPPSFHINNLLQEVDDFDVDFNAELNAELDFIPDKIF